MSDGNGEGNGNDEGAVGLLGRLRDWLGSLFGGGDSEPAPGEGAAAAGTCAVCGTLVEDPESGCPLCGSTDVEWSDGDAGEGGDGGTTGSGPEPERRSMEDTADNDAARLRDVRGETPDDGGAGGPSGGDDGAAAEGGGSPAADDGTADDAGDRRAGEG